MVSIIIPFHNSAKFIRRCLESIVIQTYPYWEIILIDDHSTDNGQSICQEFIKQHPNIYLHSSPSYGVSSARNIGINQAVGEFVCFVDSDDKLDKNFLSKLMRIADKDPLLDIIRADFEKITENGTFTIKSPWSGLYLKKDLTEKVIPEYIGPAKAGHPAVFSSVWGMLVRRRLVEGMSFCPSLNVMEDKVFVIELLFKANRAFFCNLPLYRYYVTPGSAMSCYHEYYDQNMLEVIRAISDITKRFNYRESEHRLLNLKYIAWWCVAYNEIFSNRDYSLSSKIINIFRQSCSISHRWLSADSIYLIRSNPMWLLLLAGLNKLFLKIWRKKFAVT